MQGNQLSILILGARNEYLLQHIVSGKRYIGKNAHPDPEHRWKDHQQEAFNPKSSVYHTHFHRALRKYGVDAFQFSSLTFTKSLEQLAELEMAFIKEFRANNPRFGYNSTTGGESILFNNTARRHMSAAQKKVWSLSPKRKIRLSESRKGEKTNLFGIDRKGPNNPFFGKKHRKQDLPKVLRNAALGRHTRWHKKRGIRLDECEFCRAEIELSQSTILEAHAGS